MEEASSLQIVVRFAGRVPKPGVPLTECQDAIATDYQRCAALADGVTRSEFPQQWAELLVTTFCEEQSRRKLLLEHQNWQEWLAPIQEKWIALVSKRIDEMGNTGWLQRNAFIERKPASATFIGLEFTNLSRKQARWRAVIVGDSGLFNVRKEQLFPYPIRHSSGFTSKTPAFDSFPLSEPDSFLPFNPTGTAIPGDYFLLVSDALAKWLLTLYERAGNQWSEVEALLQPVLESQEAFTKWVEKQRATSDAPLDDDVSLMVINITTSDTPSNPLSVAANSNSVLTSIPKQQPAPLLDVEVIKTTNRVLPAFVHQSELESTLIPSFSWWRTKQAFSIGLVLTLFLLGISIVFNLQSSQKSSDDLGSVASSDVIISDQPTLSPKPSATLSLFDAMMEASLSTSDGNAVIGIRSGLDMNFTFTHAGSPPFIFITLSDEEVPVPASTVTPSLDALVPPTPRRYPAGSLPTSIVLLSSAVLYSAPAPTAQLSFTVAPEQIQGVVFNVLDRVEDEEGALWYKLSVDIWSVSSSGDTVYTVAEEKTVRIVEEVNGRSIPQPSEATSRIGLIRPSGPFTLLTVEEVNGVIWYQYQLVGYIPFPTS